MDTPTQPTDGVNQGVDQNSPCTEQFIKSMIAFADRPIKELIAKLDNQDVVDRWGQNIMVDTGHISVECKDGETYHLKLDVVEKNYEMDMGKLAGEEGVLRSMSYLIHCAQSLFKVMKVGTRSLKVDMEKSTMYFHSGDAHRIGIAIEKQPNNQ
jgi:hypothetical protein